MSNDEYEIKGKDAEGKGVFTDEGFIVKKGSIARRDRDGLSKRLAFETELFSGK